MSSIDENPHESLLKFPCEFPIKAFGLANSGFSEKVFEIVSRHAVINAQAIQIRSSKTGKYDAVTATIIADSKAQIDAIYTDLTACPDVIMSL